MPRHDIAVFVRRLTGLLRPGVYNLQVQAPDEVARHGITQDVEFMVR